MGELEQAIVDATKVVSWQNMFHDFHGLDILGVNFVSFCDVRRPFQRSRSNMFEEGASRSMLGDEGVIQVSCILHIPVQY